MIKIESIDTFAVRLPFRFAFGHNLATRDFSENVIVRATVKDDHGRTFTGYGEGVPRDYVTGENINKSLTTIRERYCKQLVGFQCQSGSELVAKLEAEFYNFALDREIGGAAWCAFELAILDAFSRATDQPLTRLLSDALSPRAELQVKPYGAIQNRSDSINYGGVIPFGGKKAVIALAAVYKLFGFRTLKLKVGRNFSADETTLKKIRRLVGEQVKLRLDANCAWTAAETIERGDALRPIGILSFEQPMPAHQIAADESASLSEFARVTVSINQKHMVDESLCTIESAQKLIERRAANAFNVRVSKVGGLLSAIKIVALARQSGIECHLGAQVGESGILTQAALVLESLAGPFANYEGGANFILLKKDLTVDNLTFGLSGRSRSLAKVCAPGVRGLGVTVNEDQLRELSIVPSVDPLKPSNTRAIVSL